jgi:hypothetical protein
MVLKSNLGCFLPFLIVFNLFFGWVFLKPLHWLVLEVILVFLLILNGLFVIKKITSSLPPGPHQGRGRANSVDTEAEVIEER